MPSEASVLSVQIVKYLHPRTENSVGFTLTRQEDLLYILFSLPCEQAMPAGLSSLEFRENPPILLNRIDPRAGNPVFACATDNVSDSHQSDERSKMLRLIDQDETWLVLEGIESNRRLSHTRARLLSAFAWELGWYIQWPHPLCHHYCRGH